MADPLDRNRFPASDWALVESEYDASDAGTTETLFAVGNGYLGLRGNVDEGRDSHAHGSFINGFHETWPIHHAEAAFGFAQVGQTIVNVPDAKTIRLYVDDEPLILSEADLISYERRLDFADGVLAREIEWSTPSGKRVLIRSRRMVSFTDRHLAMIDYEVTLLDGNASVTISSQVLNRQDGRDEYVGNSADSSAAFDPRKAESLPERVLQPKYNRSHHNRQVLGYRCTNSGMTIACAVHHEMVTANECTESSHIEDDLAKHIYTIRAKVGQPIRLTKMISYHTSQAVPTRELADRCDRTLDRALEDGSKTTFAKQRAWMTDFWQRSDVEIPGQPEIQQATRWNLFQLAQATARTDGGGIAAKGVSGSGYGGHYFWDTEIYVLPYLTYTAPQVARNALRFRQTMLGAARDRASELNQLGALFPWRTINGLESSAYYAAGTAQYHIDADVAHALQQYVAATGDEEFLARGAIDILVETSRLWADLGFWRTNGSEAFHIHGVTGPDEYTTVVNDNLYTNVMARANLRTAVAAAERLRESDPRAYDQLVARVELRDEEVAEWTRAADSLYIPYDARLGIHPQDAQFLEKELWDLPKTPADKRPLLLHYHPLVIYRFQVLKQADVVLALLLQGDQFTPEEKLADFDYYDPLTTGDSTLSAVAQSIVAAEVGYHGLAMKYFLSGLFVDLANLHRNTADGVHVAATGGVWGALVQGFGGMRDHGGVITFDPRLPEEWDSLRFRITVHGTRVHVTVRQDSLEFEACGGDAVEFSVRGRSVKVEGGKSTVVTLVDQGPYMIGVPSASDIEGSRRPDGSVMTSSIPTIAGESTEPDVTVE